jgi:hypothetical protein
MQEKQKEFDEKFTIIDSTTYGTVKKMNALPMDVWQWIAENFVPVEAIVRQGVSQPVQTAGLNKALEDIANRLSKVETDVRIEITIEKGYGCISLYDQYADKIGDFDTSESLPTMEDVLDYVIGRAKHLPKE